MLLQYKNFFMLYFRANQRPLFIFQLFEFTKQNFYYFALKRKLVTQNSTQSFLKSSSLNDFSPFQTNFETILFD